MVSSNNAPLVDEVATKNVEDFVMLVVVAVMSELFRVKIAYSLPQQ